MYEPLVSLSDTERLILAALADSEETNQQQTTVERLNVLLHIKQEEHIAEQQRQLFNKGEGARRQGNYAEALRCWRELQQQNPTFRSEATSLGERFEEELLYPIFQEGKKASIARGVRHLWWELQYRSSGGIGLDAHVSMLLGEYAEQAGKDGDWQLVCDLLRELSRLKPSDERLQKRLEIAEQNLSVVPQYEQARQHISRGEFDQAVPLLQTVWNQAPHYGDPAQLALATDLYSPLPPSRYVIQASLVGVVGIIFGLLFHSALLCLLASVTSAALLTYSLYRKHSGKLHLHAVSASVGIIVAFLLTLLFAH